MKIISIGSYCRWSTFCFGALCGLFLSIPAHSQEQAFAWYPSATLSPGQGVDIENPAAQRGTGVQFDSLAPVDIQPGTAVQPRFDVAPITSTRALESFTTFDFDLDANYLFFSGGSSVPWLTTYNFQGPTFVWGLRVYCDYGRYSVKNPILTPDAKLASSNPASFRSQYGDNYVSEIRKAALVTVLFSIEDCSPTTVQELQRLMSSGLTYNNSGGQVSGSFDSFLAQAMNLGTVHVKILSHGGPEIGISTGTIGSIVDITSLDTLLTNWVSGVSDQNAVPVVYYTSPYTPLGATVPIPTNDQTQTKLEQLADNYYTAAQERQKIKSILGDWTIRYSYLERSLFSTFQSDQNRFDAYMTSLIALAPEVRDHPTTTAIPDLPTIAVPWPSPSIVLTYHTVTLQGAATSSPYTVIDGSIHGFVVRDILLVGGGVTKYDLTQSSEDINYLTAHIEQNNFLYNGQFFGTHGTLPGQFKSDSYVMRWVSTNSTTGLDGLTAVAIDTDGDAIAFCPLRHGKDKALATAPAGQLSE